MWTHLHEHIYGPYAPFTWFYLSNVFFWIWKISIDCKAWILNLRRLCAQSPFLLLRYFMYPLYPENFQKTRMCFLGGLSLRLNHLIALGITIYDWPFGTLPFRLFGSNLDTRDLETYSRTYSSHFWNMSIFDDSRAVWVLFRKWVVWENQSFLDEGAIVTPLSV